MADGEGRRTAAKASPAVVSLKAEPETAIRKEH